MGKFYRCRKCGLKIHATYLGQHWLRKHFELMYMIVEYETQSVWAMDGETGETKAVQGETKDEIDKKYGYQGCA